MSMRRAFGICPDCNARNVNRRLRLSVRIESRAYVKRTTPRLACNHRFRRELAKKSEASAPPFRIALSVLRQAVTSSI